MTQVPPNHGGTEKEGQVQEKWFDKTMLKITVYLSLSIVFGILSWLCVIEAETRKFSIPLIVISSLLFLLGFTCAGKYILIDPYIQAKRELNNLPRDKY